MRRRYKAGIGVAALTTTLGAGIVAGRKLESRKSIFRKVKDAIEELA